ncbi:hypothetical protein EBQ90_11115 [bacterium]|nr:hypothetical protein [bacterium]
MKAILFLILFWVSLAPGDQKHAPEPLSTESAPSDSQSPTANAAQTAKNPTEFLRLLEEAGVTKEQALGDLKTSCAEAIQESEKEKCRELIAALETSNQEQDEPPQKEVSPSASGAATRSGPSGPSRQAELREPSADAPLKEKLAYATALRHRLEELGGAGLDPRAYQTFRDGQRADVVGNFGNYTSRRDPGNRPMDLKAAAEKSGGPKDQEARAALFDSLSTKLANYEQKLVTELVQQGSSEELEARVSGLSAYGKVDLVDALQTQFVNAPPEKEAEAKEKFEKMVRAVYPSGMAGIVLQGANANRLAIQGKKEGRTEDPRWLEDEAALRKSLLVQDPRVIEQLRNAEELETQNQRNAEAVLAASPEAQANWETSVSLMRKGIREKLPDEATKQAFDAMVAVPLLVDGQLGFRLMPNSEQQQKIAAHYLNSSLNYSFTDNMESRRSEATRIDRPYPVDFGSQLGILAGKDRSEGVRTYSSGGLERSVGPEILFALVPNAGRALVAKLGQQALAGAAGGTAVGGLREGTLYLDSLYNGKKYDAEGATQRVAEMAALGAFLVPSISNAPKAVQTVAVYVGAVAGGASAVAEARSGNFITAATDLGMGLMAAGALAKNATGARTAVSNLNSDKGNGVLAMLGSSNPNEQAVAQRFARQLIASGEIKTIPSSVLGKVSPETAQELSALLPKQASSSRGFLGRAYDYFFAQPAEKPSAKPSEVARLPAPSKTLEPYSPRVREVAQKVAQERGISVDQLSPDELRTMAHREDEIASLMTEGLSYEQARLKLERVGLVLSGQNSFNKVVPAGGGKPESLHRVASQVLGQLPENFHELPRAERLRLAREVIGTAWDVQPTTPFVAEKGKNQGLLLDVLSETVADIRPVPSVVPRYRSVPVPEGGISTADDAQRLFSLDSKGGYVHTAPSREGALNFTPGAQSRAVFVYPEGTPAFVVNGEGQVFSGARDLQASIDPKRFQTFANNDWGVLPRDLRVGRVSPDPDGTVMIYLEAQPAPKTASGATGASSVPVPSAAKPYQIELNRMGARAPATEVQPLSSFGAAMSEAKWRVGITRGQSPTQVHTVETMDSRGNRARLVQEIYEINLGDGAGKTPVLINAHEAGGAHALPHVEVGIPKTLTPEPGSPINYYGNKMRVFWNDKKRAQ